MSVTHATLPAGKVRKAQLQSLVHEFSGGALGSLLFRDTGAVDGASWLAAGTAGHVLTANGVGVAPSWQAPSGSGGTPAGLNTQIQFNDGGAFGGDAGMTFEKTNDQFTLTVANGITSFVGAQVTSGRGPLLVNHTVTDQTLGGLALARSAWIETVFNPASAPGSSKEVAGLQLYGTLGGTTDANVALRGLRAEIRSNSNSPILLVNGATYDVRHTGTGTFLSIIGQSNTAVLTGAATGTNVLGQSTPVSVTAAATLTNLAGVYVQPTVTNAGAVVTNFYGYRITNLSNSGTITNTYGVHVGDITAGTQTNQAYSFFASDENARNYFGGRAESPVFRTTTALITAVDGGATAAFTANMVGSTGGPATAAQNGWMKFQDSTGATVWVPVWK